MGKKEETPAELSLGNRVRIPTPRFVVFYNGTEKQPERKILRLSESFYRQEEEPSLELIVLQLNISMMKSCIWRR